MLCLYLSCLVKRVKDMSEENKQFFDLDWIPIPNESYILKYIFSENGYNIMVSDLQTVCSEKLSEADVQQRFSKLNPSVDMKPQVILENLKKSLLECLAGNSNLNLRHADNKLVITLKFPVAHITCYYDIEMNLREKYEKVMECIITPLIFGAFLSQKKFLKLESSLENTRSSASRNVPVSSQDVVDPQWLNGKAPFKFILDSFLKLQNHFKELQEENSRAYLTLGKEKLKISGTTQSAISPKKPRLLQNSNGESSTLKFEDSGLNISIKEEVKTENDLHSFDINGTASQVSESCSASLSQSSRNSKKKKKVFKV